MERPDRHLLQAISPSCHHKWGAHRRNSGKSIRIFVCQIPGAEAAHTMAGQINPGQIDGILLLYSIQQNDQRLSISPELAVGAQRRDHNKRERFLFFEQRW